MIRLLKKLIVLAVVIAQICQAEPVGSCLRGKDTFVRKEEGQILSQNRNMIEEEKTFIESIYGEIFKAASFSLSTSTELLIVYENPNYNLEFHYDNRYGTMVYGGMYVRVRESDKTYRINDMVAFFDPGNRTYQELAKPYKDENTIDLRVHAALIHSHLLSLLKSADHSWEPKLREYLAKRYPWYK